MSRSALKVFSHVWPVVSPKRRPATFFPNSYTFSESTERRLQQEDRLIALGLIICFLVQGLVWLL